LPPTPGDRSTADERTGCGSNLRRGDGQVTEPVTNVAGTAPEEVALSSSERVYVELKRRILSGQLMPRTRLVELRLAQDLKVSRTPVREALKRLMAERLVSMDPERGIVVSEVDAREIEEIYVIREVLDGLAARLAAERASTAEVDKFQLLMGIMRNSVEKGQLDAVVQGNIVFHDLLHRTAGNDRLRALSSDLANFVRRFSVESFASRERMSDMLIEHEEIVRAIEARDPERAEQVARGHIAAARDFHGAQLLAQFLEVDGSPAS
jgi:DNA-binding GntR family transcriptional regulator